ncbi:hypothetical protein ACTU3I_17640 [Microbacterium sp. RD1]|uniref:hypothetical protein n=1 Tax=Microbacterium sp. RD1 TaxID=3457313 RepID=UPI003FA56685
MNGVAWVLAAAFIVAGVLAYTGRWKGWIATARGYGTYIGFSLLYLGVAFALAGLALSLADVSRPAFLILIAVAGVALVLAVIGFWWLPRFLVPEWFRRLRSSALGRKGPS